jgi:hypothetical protein
MTGLPGYSTRWVISVLAVSLFLGMAGCNSAHVREVVAIEKTRTYHREQCPPVAMAKTEVMTISEARARQLRACPVCKPDSE